MPSMNISVPTSLQDSVEQQIENGQFTNPTDHVRDLIRRDQRRPLARQALATALIESDQAASGPAASPTY